MATFDANLVRKLDIKRWQTPSPTIRPKLMTFLSRNEHRCLLDGVPPVVPNLLPSQILPTSGVIALIVKAELSDSESPHANVQETGSYAMDLCHGRTDFFIDDR
jgi:hypothetical protein